MNYSFQDVLRAIGPGCLPRRHGDFSPRLSALYPGESRLARLPRSRFHSPSENVIVRAGGGFAQSPNRHPTSRNAHVRAQPARAAKGSDGTILQTTGNLVGGQQRGWSVGVHLRVISSSSRALNCCPYASTAVGGCHRPASTRCWSGCRSFSETRCDGRPAPKRDNRCRLPRA